jgi:hypothetical protein
MSFTFTVVSILKNQKTFEFLHIMKKQKIKLQTALQNNETFLAFLTQEVQSEKYKQLRKNVSKTPHLSKEKLYDYVLGWLDDQDARQVRDHIALCGECAQEAMRIMQFEDELEEDSLEWADTSPASFEKPVDRLKADVKTGSSTEEDIFQSTSKKVSITESLVRWICGHSATGTFVYFRGWRY